MLANRKNTKAKLTLFSHRKLSGTNKITSSDLKSTQVKFKGISHGNPDVMIKHSSTSKNLKFVRNTNKPLLRSQTRNNKRALKRQKKISYQLGLVVFSFMIGYLPVGINALWWAMTSDKSLYGYWFGVASYFCMCFSECLNPFMYNLASRKLRTETKTLLLKIQNKFFLKH